VFDSQRRMSILFGHAWFDAMRAAEVTRDELVPIANAEDWDLQLVDFWVHRGAGRFGDACRSPRDDDPSDTVEVASGMTHVGDDGVHAQLKDAAGDEVAVLAARVEDDNLVHGRCNPSVDAPASAPAGRPCPRS